MVIVVVVEANTTFRCTTRPRPPLQRTASQLGAPMTSWLARRCRADAQRPPVILRRVGRRLASRIAAFANLRSLRAASGGGGGGSSSQRGPALTQIARRRRRRFGRSAYPGLLRAPSEAGRRGPTVQAAVRPTAPPMSMLAASQTTTTTTAPNQVNGPKERTQRAQMRPQRARLTQIPGGQRNERVACGSATSTAVVSRNSKQSSRPPLPRVAPTNVRGRLARPQRRPPRAIHCQVRRADK